MPVPKAITKALISSNSKTLSSLARSVFNIFPLRGKIAWNFLSRPCFAEPPALSPSTIYNSESAGSLFWQSASFPGKVIPSRAPFLITASLAALAAALALAASITFSKIALPSEGFSSKNISKPSLTTWATIGWSSLFPSFSLVCDSNWIRSESILMEITAVNPSLTSSPVKFSSFSFRASVFLA